MKKSSIQLLPEPKSVRWKDGQLRLDAMTEIRYAEDARGAAMRPALQISAELRRSAAVETRVLCSNSRACGGVRLEIKPRHGLQGYRLAISPSGVTVAGGDAAGLYYGVQALRQLTAQCGRDLPCVEIKDRPDYPVRGYYLDISRGKVPKLRTLLRFVEKLAHYRINHFQLYVEHTFAFRNHPEIWAGSDALSHEDMLRLDAHCREHHIEFVPSLNTFGHCYRAVRNQRNQHLNELEIEAAEMPFSYRNAMCHYTLDCSNPQSLRLVDDMIGEMAPLFHSGLFNICCDETFDLGQGRNRQRAEKEGTGQLYLEFLLKVIDCVQRRARKPMFWGDLILKHPELIERLPEDAIILHWDYAAKVRAEACRRLGHSGRTFYVCGSVDGWRKWMHDLNHASLNIVRLARLGKKHGAAGFLNTDWGDIGNANFLSGSYHGMALGAACSWNLATAANDDFAKFDRAFAVLELGDPTGKTVKLLREVSQNQLVNWADVSMWRDPADDMPAAWFDQDTGFPSSVLRVTPSAFTRAEKRLAAAEDELARLCDARLCADRHWLEETLTGICGARLMLRIGITMKRQKQPNAKLPDVSLPELADAIRWFERRLTRLWHRRNRPSEYYRLRMDLLDAAERLDKMTRTKAPGR
jgi:hypothetical protein